VLNHFFIPWRNVLNHLFHIKNRRASYLTIFFHSPYISSLIMYILLGQTKNWLRHN
jgi:hypothetical protein